LGTPDAGATAAVVVAATACSGAPSLCPDALAAAVALSLAGLPSVCATAGLPPADLPSAVWAAAAALALPDLPSAARTASGLPAFAAVADPPNALSLSSTRSQ